LVGVPDRQHLEYERHQRLRGLVLADDAEYVVDDLSPLQLGGRSLAGKMDGDSHLREPWPFSDSGEPTTVIVRVSCGA
jgi:hypothetical protein